jgi:hypothetical protein
MILCLKYHYQTPVSKSIGGEHLARKGDGAGFNQGVSQTTMAIP